ncbi:MAG: hypothetical protein Q4A78_12390 [Peptostreptococcaceae bacterium]|nr:hypothetical protein [Peptostreptococcaceae bacterium]
MGKKKGKKKRPPKKGSRLRELLEITALVAATIYYLIQIYKEFA